MAGPYAVVLVTVPNAQAAEKVATALLERRLAACVNQIPNIRSSYWWQGKIERSEELLLVIKTRAKLTDALAACVKENHPYSVPEVVALPITGGLPDYLQWLGDGTRPPKIKAAS